MTYTIGFSNIDDKNETAILLREGIQAAARALDIEVIYRNNDLSTDVARENVVEFADYPVDAAIIAHFDERSGRDLVMPLKLKNIPVISVLIEIPLTVYFGPDDHAGGQVVGDYLGQWVNANWNGRIDKMLFLTCHEILQSHAKRVGGVLESLGAHLTVHPDNILYVDDGADPAVARERVTTVLGNWMPYDHIAVVTMNDYIGGGALQAIYDLGRESQTILGSFDGTQMAINEFRKPFSPLLISPGFRPEEFGAQIVDLALDLLEGHKTPHRILVEPTVISREEVM